MYTGDSTGAKQDNVSEMRPFHRTSTLASTVEEEDDIDRASSRGSKCWGFSRRKRGRKLYIKTKRNSIQSCFDNAVKQVSRQRSFSSHSGSIIRRRSSDMSEPHRKSSFRTHRLHSQTLDFGPMDTACNLEYPMWVVPIETVLTMQRLEPHQVLKERGDLVMQHTYDTCNVIFISHQWISIRHPDPDGEQLKVLQEALARLLAGQEVRSTAVSSVLFERDEVEKNWPKILAKARIWYDFFSIPQISYDPWCGIDLTRAIRSIPAYVEMSSYTFVLSPPVAHRDFVDAITGVPTMCDYFSWLERGWCLLEKMAQFLKVDSNPVVVIRSGRLMEFQDHLDTISRRLGDANFSCCAQNHIEEIDDDTAPGGRKKVPIRCDKIKVRQLFECLIKRRLQYELEDPNGSIDIYRLLRSLRAFFLSSLPHPEDYDPYEDECTVESWLTAYHFTQDIVSKKTRRLRGYTPLRFAALSGNSYIVRRFLEMKAEVNAPFEKHDARWGIFRGCNILCHTAIFCSSPDWQDCMTLLLEAKADVQSGGVDVLNNACLPPKPTRLVTMVDAIAAPEAASRNWGVEWVFEHVVTPRLLDVDVVCPNYNNPNCVLSTCSRSGNIQSMEWLAKHGADFTKRFAVHGADLLFCACSTSPTSSVSMVEYCVKQLKEAGLTVDMNRRLRLPMVLYWSVYLMVKCGNRRAWLRSVLFWHGATALLTATLEGKCGVVQWLLDHHADPHIPNAAGETALKVAMRCGYLNVVDVLLKYQSDKGESDKGQSDKGT